MATVTINGRSVQVVSPEGQTANLSVADLVGKLAPRLTDTGEVVLPDGIKSVQSRGHLSVWVHQTPPRVFRFKWIAQGSAAHFGPGTKYREVRLALPYLITLAVFGPGEDNQMQLGPFNECFFRNAPLDGLDDALFYPALLNCSKFHPVHGLPLAWICSQHLDRGQFVGEPDLGRRLRAGFQALLHCLLETGFNYSSEHHEQSSWFTESARVDPRIATVERWQEESEKDPLFVLEVPWLKTGLSVRQVVERIFINHHAYPVQVSSAADVARLVFNHGHEHRHRGHPMFSGQFVDPMAPPFPSPIDPEADPDDVP